MSCILIQSWKFCTKSLSLILNSHWSTRPISLSIDFKRLTFLNFLSSGFLVIIIRFFPLSSSLPFSTPGFVCRTSLETIMDSTCSVCRLMSRTRPTMSGESPFAFVACSKRIKDVVVVWPTAGWSLASPTFFFPLSWSPTIVKTYTSSLHTHTHTGGHQLCHSFPMTKTTSPSLSSSSLESKSLWSSPHFFQLIFVFFFFHISRPVVHNGFHSFSKGQFNVFVQFVGCSSVSSSVQPFIGHVGHRCVSTDLLFN